MKNQDILDFLKIRASATVKDMQPLAPTKEEWQEIFAGVSTTPDHGRLMPYRFIVLTEDREVALHDFMLKYKIKQFPDREEKIRYKMGFMAEHIGGYVIAYALIDTTSNISEQDQEYCTAAACMQLLLATQAMGYTMVWYSVGIDTADFVQYLEIPVSDKHKVKFAGLLPVGRLRGELQAKKRPNIDDFALFS